MPIHPRRTVVLLPTYNERENVEAITRTVLRAAPVDVWILDDASPDGTGEIADEIAAREPNVQVIHRAGKQGLGKAYVDGFRRALAAGYERIIQMDADFSHPAAKLTEMLELAETHDLVLGSRWVPGGGTKNWPLSRQLISRCGSLYARILLGIPVRDVTGGFKCFRREVLENIDIDSIQAAGYVFQIEATFRALKKGYSVVETPIVFTERENGESKMSRKIVIEAVMRVPLLRLGLG